MGVWPLGAQRADPGLLHGFAGRGASGALLHLRVPAVWAPEPGGLWAARDAEAGETRTIRLTPEAALRVARRAQSHADRGARHALQVGLAYLPFAPAFEPEALRKHAQRFNREAFKESIEQHISVRMRTSPDAARVAASNS